MEDVSRQVARLEKEFVFWTGMYPQGIMAIEGTLLHQLICLNSMLKLIEKSTEQSCK